MLRVQPTVTRMRTCRFPVLLLFVALTVVRAAGQPTSDFNPRARYLRMQSEFTKQVEEKKATVQTWRSEARLLVALTILVGILGVAATAVQNVEKPLAKNATRLLGALIASLMVVLNTAFPEDYRVLNKKVQRARRVLDDASVHLSNFDETQIEENQKAFRTEFQAIMNRFASIEDHDFTAAPDGRKGSSIRFVRTIHAQGPPSWITVLPSDQRFLYFRGDFSGGSLTGVKNESFNLAVEAAAQALAARVQGSGQSDSVRYLPDLRDYAAKSAEVADTYYAYDRKSKTYSYSTLLRIDRRLAEPSSINAVLISSAKPRFGPLVVEIADVHGNPVREKVDLQIDQKGAGEKKDLKRLDASRPVTVELANAAANPVYQIEVRSPVHLAAEQYVRVGNGPLRVQIRLVADPSRVKAVRFPDYFRLDPMLRRMLEASHPADMSPSVSGMSLYSALDDLRRAALLNIAAKSAAVRLPSGRNVLSYCHEIVGLRADRVLVRVEPGLHDVVSRSAVQRLLQSVPGAVHKPPDGYSRTGSWKTLDRFGNLQITLFRSNDKRQWTADLDIDEKAGASAIFGVVKKSLSGGVTHPYTIHQILISHQGVDPGYRFVF